MTFSDQDRELLKARFDEYRRSGDSSIRDELVQAHLRLAHHLALRFTNRGIPTDDLIQVASLGLLRAVERFEPERGLEFSTFATPTIVGELKRHFRDKGWAIRVPRRIQELNIRLNSMVEELTQNLGRSPSIPELATALRASEEEVLEAMDAAQAYRVGSIDVDPDSDRGPGGAGIGSLLGTDDEGLVDVENRIIVDQLMETLAPREQLMLRLRFYEQMSQSQIAERLGISQMQVSRLLNRSLAEFRRRLEAGEISLPSASEGRSGTGGLTSESTP